MNNYFPKKISYKEQMFFFKQMAFMTRIGLSVSESLEFMNTQPLSPPLHSLTQALIKSVSEGHPLHRTLEQNVKNIDRSTLELLKAGETIGLLAENLERISNNLKKRRLLKQKIISAMLYPACIALGTIFLSGFLMFYIFPKIKPLFLSLRLTLPPSTRLLIFISNLVQQYWLSISLGVIITSLGTYLLIKKSVKFKFFIDRLILRLPVMRTIAINYFLTAISHDIGLRLKAYVPLDEAINSCIVTNRSYAESLAGIRTNIHQGKKLSSAMAEWPRLFPTAYTQMVATAELCGSLAETFNYLSEFYENEVEDSTKTLSSALEPTLMIVLGFIVGFISLSILLPIYELSRNFHY